MYRHACALALATVLGECGSVWASPGSPAAMRERDRWVAAALPGAPVLPRPVVGLTVMENHGLVLQNSWCGQALRVGRHSYYRGLFCHAPSRVRVTLAGPARTFRAFAGVQTNFMTSGSRGSVVFAIAGSDGAELYRSGLMREGMAPEELEVALQGAQELTLVIEDGGDGIACDQALWGDAQVVLDSGELLWIGDLAILDGQQGVPFPQQVPFSFTYDGKPSAELLASWPRDDAVQHLDDQRTGYTARWPDPDTGLLVHLEATLYRDFPTVEWVVRFANEGQAPTPILEHVQGIDLALTRFETGHPELGEFVLHYNRGDDLKVTNYEPLTQTLGPRETLGLSSSGGRPTQFQFPYFNLEWLSEGVIIAIGWPGQWAAEFARDEGLGLRVRGGQELTRLRLEPGESIRTPRTVLQFYKGDSAAGQNAWRGWMRAHNMPRPGGRPLGPQWNANMRGETLERADAASQIAYIDGFAREGLSIHYWWMDAGWYEGAAEHGWPFTGTWEVDRTRFPGGLRAVSDHAHAKGMKTIVWFEPERVVPGTSLYENHPQWLLGRDGEQKLLDLGNTEARQWLVDHIDHVIKNERIDLYRQDFNIDPLGYWRSTDAEDRQGVTENRYISGYLAFWDELLARNPDLLIDSCASGGRRNDLETLRRSVPKHRSDLIFEPTSQQCMTYALSAWFPFHGSGILSHDEYEFWSCMAPSYTTAWDVQRPDLPYDELRRWGAQFLEAAEYQLNGDFYPLTPYSTDSRVWLGWQFDRPDLGAGLVQMFRRPDSLYEVGRCPLRGLDPWATYDLRALGSEETWHASGKELMQEGLRIAISDRPGAAIVVYCRE